MIQILKKYKITALAAAALLTLGGYLGYAFLKTGAGETRYLLAAAQKGALTSYISGSGQVAVTNQLNLKAKASGDVVYVGAKNGQGAAAGALLVQLDARDAQKAVRDAEVNLESARISLEKLKKPADHLSILQAENALAQAKESKRKAEDDLGKAYEDGFNAVASAFLDLPGVMIGTHDILNGTNISSGQANAAYYADSIKNYEAAALNYKDDAMTAHQKARQAYDQNFQDYKLATRFSDIKIIGSLIGETYETAKKIAEAVKSANNLIQFYQDKLTERNLTPQPVSHAHLANLNTYTGKTNTHLLNLLSLRRTIETSKETIINAERSIAEKTESLAKLKAGAEPLDIRSQELILRQRENSLLDAKEKLADYFIRAPMDGIIARVEVKKGDPVSANAVVAALITRSRIAEISLNEVDAAKVKVGERATLTFDALPDLKINGEVAEIDVVGAVSQGVVSYTVKITFDTRPVLRGVSHAEDGDERVKPGMSVSADIVTESKNDILMIPNAAVKSRDGFYFVEIPENQNLASQRGGANAAGVTFSNLPSRRAIETGISNDEFTEVVSGLEEGEVVVSGVINPQASANPNSRQQTPAFRIPGLPGGGSGRGGFR